jgi:hypothetical protein
MIASKTSMSAMYHTALLICHEKAAIPLLAVLKIRLLHVQIDQMAILGATQKV